MSVFGIDPGTLCESGRRDWEGEELGGGDVAPGPGKESVSYNERCELSCECTCGYVCNHMSVDWMCKM